MIQKPCEIPFFLLRVPSLPVASSCSAAPLRSASCSRPTPCVVAHLRVSIYIYVYNTNIWYIIAIYTNIFIPICEIWKNPVPFLMRLPVVVLAHRHRHVRNLSQHPTTHHYLVQNAICVWYKRQRKTNKHLHDVNIVGCWISRHRRTEIWAPSNADKNEICETTDMKTC